MSELTLKQACAETQKFARFLKGMERLAEVAQALESADQAVADRRREEAALFAALASLRGEHEQLQAKVAEENELAKNVRSAAIRDRDQLLEATKAEANDLVAAARAEVDKARQEAAAVLGRASAAERQVNDKARELAEINARIEQARGEARKIIGG